MSNMHKRKLREALQINGLKILNETVLIKIKVLNKDSGDYVTTSRGKLVAAGFPKYY